MGTHQRGKSRLNAQWTHSSVKNLELSLRPDDACGVGDVVGRSPNRSVPLQSLAKLKAVDSALWL